MTPADRERIASNAEQQVRREMAYGGWQRSDARNSTCRKRGATPRPTAACSSSKVRGESDGRNDPSDR